MTQQTINNAPRGVKMFVILQGATYQFIGGNGTTNNDLLRWTSRNSIKDRKTYIQYTDSTVAHVNESLFKATPTNSYSSTKPPIDSQTKYLYHEYCRHRGNMPLVLPNTGKG